jgi:hypothetical protein
MALITLVGLTAAGAGAQTITKATFNLPMQAYWNDMMLQPGAYTLSMDRTSSGVELINLRGETIAKTFFTPAGARDSSGHSYLSVDNINGAYVIRQFDEGPLGRAYKFAVPKTVRNLTLRGAATQPATVTVPVTAASGL